MVTRILLILLGVFALVCGPCWAADATANLKAAAAHLADFTDGYYLNGKPGAVEALHSFRVAAQNWSVAYLNAHPKAAPAEIEAAAPLIEKERSFAVEALAPGLFAISVRYYETGIVFLVERLPQRYRVLWDFDGPAYARNDTDRAMFGTVHRLPVNATGQIRFYIDAAYAQPAGATHRGQLSFWQWDGKDAHLLLARDYATNEDEPVTHDGDRVKIRAKQQFKAIGAYGCCAGRQMDWTFAVGPNAVRDLGEKPVLAELDTVDAVLDRLWNGKAATELASPSVVAALEPLIAEQHADDVRRGAAPFEELAKLRDAAVDRSGDETQLCLVLDQWKGPKTADVVRRLVFTVPRGSAFLKSLTITPGNDSAGCQDFAGKAP